jgi:type IV pilus assembly protein PilP
MSAVRTFLSVALMGLTLGLTGCGASGTDDLRQWMIEQRNSISPKVEPISEPKKFLAQAYGGEASVAPFSTEKLMLALRSETTVAGNSALVKPELSRRKEPLEFMPLDSMAMVGVLDRQGRKVGLVRIDKLLYQVRVGQYLGQNFGRITRIGDTEITLREIVQDAAGDWVERPATLQLQEGSQK